MATATKSTTKKSTTSTKTIAVKSPVVGFNPKTGAKLKAGESVNVGGKIYTQGSTAIGGTSSTKASIPTKSVSKPGIIKTTPTKSSSYSTVPGKLPGQMIAKSTTTSPDAINSSKSSVVKYPTAAPTKTPTFGNPFAGGFLKNVVGGAKTAFSGAKTAISKVANAGNLGANASGANVVDKALNPTQFGSNVTVPKNTGLDYTNSAVNTNMIESSPQYQREQTQLMAKEDATQNIVNNFLTSTGQPVTQPVLANSSSSGQMSSGASSTPALDAGATTTSKTTSTLADGSTNVTTTQAPAQQAATSYNLDVATGTRNQMQMLTDSLNKSKADPYNKYNTQSDQIKYTDTALSNISKQFNTPQQALDEYNRNPDFKASVDQLTQTTGKNINDIASKVTTVTNGITGPQTTADYLAGGPASLNGIKNATNAALSESAQFNAAQIKATNDALETQKTEAKSMVDFYTKQELRLDKSEREKATFAVDKARAEFEANDAETEQQRVVATENLKNFLAKIGAFSTDGAAGVGLANLEQKYQAQRSALKSAFQLASREIEINMNDHLNTLESDRDERIFKINQDISKSEREVALDVMKINHDTQKDILAAKLRYAEDIKQEKDKAASKAKESTKSYYDQFFTATGLKTFQDTTKEYQDTWKANSSQWITPDYKGQIGGEQVAKSFSQYNVDNGNIEETLVKMQGPDGIQYNVPQNNVDSFIKDGGRKL